MNFFPCTHLGRALFSSVVALTLGVSGAAAGTQNIQIRVVDSVPEHIILARRTNGPARTAETTASNSESTAASSNGRNRGGSVGEESASGDLDAPIVLQFAQETATTRPSGSNGRGRKSSAIVDEIPSFDLADTLPEALDAAAPETNAEKLARYQAARQALFDAASKQEETYTTYLQVQQLNADAVKAAYPDGGHMAAISSARQTYYAARESVATKQAEAQAILMELSGGTPLSDDAVRELNGLLGV